MDTLAVDLGSPGRNVQVRRKSPHPQESRKNAAALCRAAAGMRLVRARMRQWPPISASPPHHCEPGPARTSPRYPNTLAPTGTRARNRSGRGQRTHDVRKRRRSGNRSVKSCAAQRLFLPENELPRHQRPTPHQRVRPAFSFHPSHSRPWQHRTEGRQTHGIAGLDDEALPRGLARTARCRRGPPLRPPAACGAARQDREHQEGPGRPPARTPPAPPGEQPGPVPPSGLRYVRSVGHGFDRPGTQGPEAGRQEAGRQEGPARKSDRPARSRSTSSVVL